MVGIPDAEGMPVDYGKLAARARVMPRPNRITVMAAGLRDIVTSKTYAGRRKDAEALPELRRLLRAEEEAGQDPHAGP